MPAWHTVWPGAQRGAWRRTPEIVQNWRIGYNNPTAVIAVHQVKGGEMNILAILGSRYPQGQTARTVNALLAGARSESARQVFLPECGIERCRQCDQTGWGLCRSEGRCVIDDDFASLVESIKAADAVVFATPVYFGDLSESMRAFTDRLRRVIRNNEDKSGIQDKIAIGICVAGGGGGGAPTCTVSLEKVLRTCGFDLVDLIPVRRQNLEMKLEVLEVTGKWLATLV